MKNYKIEVKRLGDPKPIARVPYLTAVFVEEMPLTSWDLPLKVYHFKEFDSYEKARVYTLKHDGWEIAQPAPKSGAMESF